MAKIFLNASAYEIPLTKGKSAKVSAEDYEYLKQFYWHYSKRGYACARINNKLVLMHRLILKRKLDRDITPKEQCDHINHERIDNTRENLRIASNQQNCFNAGKVRRKCSSQYKGVCLSIQRYKSKDGSIKEYLKWIAYIKKDRKRIHIGCFKTEEEAARAYHAKAVILFGEYANVNKVA